MVGRRRYLHVMTDTFAPAAYAFAGMFNPRWDGYPADHTMLSVRVFMSNDDGDQVQMLCWGPTVDEAIDRLLESRRRGTQDDSWAMDEWEAA